MAERTLQQLAQIVGGQLTGDGSRIVRGLASLDAARDDEVSFLANARYVKHMAATRAAAVIVSQDYQGPGDSLIRCKDPYFAFRNAMVECYGFRQPHFEGVDARANIEPTAVLEAGVKIAAFVTVAAGARVGAGTVLYPGVYVGPNARIGRDCTIHPNVAIYDGCILGDRVTVHACTSIGQDGFGYATHGGRHEKIPAAGWVELEGDVEIGAGCAIDRATLGATVIGAGTKFSDGVVIGHGTRLGRHCLMSAQSGLAGSTMTGDYCVLGAQSGAVGHIHLGDGARVAAQAGVTNDVPAKQDVIGSPAMPMAEGRRALVSLRALPELRRTVQRLEQELAELKRRLETEHRP